MQFYRSHRTTNVSVRVVTSFPHRWIRLLRTPGSISCIAVLLITLVGAFPALMSALYVTLGTRILVAAQDKTTSQGYVTYALDLLEQARDWSPSNPQVYRMLARAYKLNDQPEQAVAALEQAYRLHPASLLIQQELAVAYEVAGYTQKAHALWRRLGVTAAQMVAIGDERLDQQEYRVALVWYNRASRYDPDIESELGLRRFLAAHLVGLPDARILLGEARANDQSFVIYPLADTVKIHGADLRWMRSVEGIFGRPLNYGVGGNTVGYLWWTGQAFAVVDVKQAGDYQIHMHVLHGTPPPVEMAIGVNGRQVEHVLLGRGDDSWETVSTSVSLTTGLHIIQVSFLNDVFMDGKDRNAVVEWVMVEHLVSLNEL